MKAMPEQAHFKTTSDQGWSQMKIILDQEMPIEKRSRRLIVIWPFAGILLMGLAGLFLLQANASSTESNLPVVPLQETPTKTLPKQENQIEEKKEIDKNGFAFQDAGTSGASMNSEANKKSAPGKKSLAVSNSSPTKTENISTNKTPSTSNPEIPTTGNIVFIDADAYLTNTEEEANIISEENVLTTTVEAHHEQDFQSQYLPVAPIPTMDLSYFTIPINELGSIQASAFTKPVKHRIYINPNIEASVLSGFNGGTGWFAGAGAGIKLSPKFDLTASLGYRSFSPGASIFPSPSADLAADPSNNTLVKNDTVFDGFYVVSESINNASYQDLDPVIESLKQWQAQVGVDWKFSRRFSFETGAGLAFHTRAYSEYPIVPNSYVLTSPNTKVGNSLEGYDVIRKTMATCFAGATYHIGKHVALKLQWAHTFQPYLSTDNNNNNILASFEQRDDFIRGITLGMKYSFL